MRLIGEAVEVARAHDVEIRLLLLPSKESVYREDLAAVLGDAAAADVLRSELEAYRRICEFAAAQNTLCYDLTDDLRRAAVTADAPLYFPPDTHWNALGSVVVADLVAAWLDPTP